MYFTGFKSVLTGKEYPKDRYDYIAEDEGPKALLSSQYDMEALKASLPGSLLPPHLGMFRYMPFLPIDPSSQIPTIQVGGTPLVEVPQSKSPFKFRLWIKDEGREPTASFKDRSSALVCVKAKEMGHKTITTASSGNAASATSAMAACLDLDAVIFVPASAPPNKVLQNRMYGARVFLVEGPYDNAVNACMEASKRFGWYNRSTGYNPFTIDGKKTVSFEICEQFGGICDPEGTVDGPWGRLGHFEAPDVIVVSAGDGNIISGVHKGLKELFAAGLISKIPRIIGVQATGCDPLYKCFREGGDAASIPTVETHTCADSIACGTPNDPIRAVLAARETGGSYVHVTDDEILEGMVEMARASGVFSEPAAATAWAGLHKAEEEGLIKPEDSVVMISTGNGLKDVASATKAIEGKSVAVNIRDQSEISG